VSKKIETISRLEALLKARRRENRRSLAIFLNCGDPDLDSTYRLILQCVAHGIDVIELGVPFPDSFTDGDLLLRSHDRALANHIEFEDARRLVEKVRANCSIPIVMLTDFSHTVRPRGIRQVVMQCQQCGADGLLLHGLPPLLLGEYLHHAHTNGINPILSLYPRTTADKMAAVLTQAKGFVYLVTTYGKSGAPVDFTCEKMRTFFNTVRNSTDLPLMAGFGIKNADDLKKVFSNPAIDGAIVGSAFCAVIETAMTDRASLWQAADIFLQSITQAKEMTYESER
jgi:tryptophan synthase alpha chain